MEFRVSKQVLSKALARVTPAVGDKSPVALLRCVLLRADKGTGRLTVLGTDNITAASASASAEVKKGGDIAVVSRLFAEAVGSMPAGDLTISIDKNHLVLKSGKARQRLPCVPGDEFPEMPQPAAGVAALELPSKELGRILAQASYAQESDAETRAHLAVTRLESRDGRVTAIASDSHRLAVASFELQTIHFAESISSRVVKPVEKLCAEFADLPVSVSTTGDENAGTLHFVWPEVALSVKRTENSFVPWTRVIPASYEHRIQLPRLALIDAVKRAQVASDVSKTKTRPVWLDFEEGSLKVSAESSDRGSSSDEIDVSYAGKSWPSAVASEYLLQALVAITDDDVLLCIGDPARAPIVVVGAVDEKSCMGVISPMRR